MFIQGHLVSKDETHCVIKQCHTGIHYRALKSKVHVMNYLWDPKTRWLKVDVEDAEVIEWPNKKK